MYYSSISCKESKEKKFKPLKILFYPEPKLQIACSKVRQEVNLSEIQQLTELMFKTMHFFKCYGLSASQIGISLQIITIDLQNDKFKPLILINPEILNFKGKQDLIETCLSFPQVSGNIKRFNEIEIKYLDENLNEKKMCVDGLLSTHIQHEIDHLNGILFFDKMSRLKKEMILKRYKKIGRL